jgi:hypothetical protein
MLALKLTILMHGCVTDKNAANPQQRHNQASNDHADPA